jgi:hypothetical protein
MIAYDKGKASWLCVLLLKQVAIIEIVIASVHVTNKKKVLQSHAVWASLVALFADFKRVLRQKSVQPMSNTTRLKNT